MTILLHSSASDLGILRMARLSYMRCSKSGESPLMMPIHQSRCSRYPLTVFLMPSSNFVSGVPSRALCGSSSGRWRSGGRNFAVSDMLDEVFGLAELLEDGLTTSMLARSLAADVVKLADATCRMRVDGAAVIIDMRASRGRSCVAVDWQLLVGQRVDDHQRDELLREVIRAVVVRAARDRRRDLVGAVIRHDQEAHRPFEAEYGLDVLRFRLLREEYTGTVERQVAVGTSSVET